MNNNVSESVTSNVLYKRIVRMIWDYPTLFKNRSDALHHLFCVNGNGYEWEQGVLRGIDEDAQGNRLTKRNPDDVFRSEQEEIDSWEKTFKNDLESETAQEIRAIGLCRIREHNSKMKYRRDNADLLALVEGDRFNIYPLCEYACMAEVPDDVHPDFLAGVREIIFLVFETPANNFGSGYSEKEREKNIQFASNVLTQLSQRFPKGHEHEPTSYEGWLQRQQELVELSRQITKECIAKLKQEKQQEDQKAREHLQQITHTVWETIHGSERIAATIAYVSGKYEFLSQDERLLDFWGWEDSHLDDLIPQIEAKGFRVEVM